MRACIGSVRHPASYRAPTASGAGHRRPSPACRSFTYASANSAPSASRSIVEASNARSASSRFSGSRRASATVCPSVYMLMSSRPPGSRRCAIPSSPAASSPACSRYGLAAPSAEPELETAGVGNADHVGAIVAAIGHRVRRPGRARRRHRRVDALVGIHRRIGQRAQRLGMRHHPADELIAERGQPKFAGGIGKQVLFVPPAATARHARGSPSR